MKIAICLSGFIRTWEYTKNSFIKNLCLKYDVDVYVHTYYQNYFEHSAQMQDILYTEEQILKMFDGINIKSIIIEDRNSILPLLKLKSEKFIKCKGYEYLIKESSDDNAVDIRLGIRIMDQLRKIELCNNLRKDYEIKNNIKYDFVCRARFDMCYLNKANWDILNDDAIHRESNGSIGADFCIAGKPSIMDMAFNNRYSELENLCLKDNVPLCAHATLCAHACKNNVQLKNDFVIATIIRSKDKAWNCSVSSRVSTINSHYYKDLILEAME